MTEYGTQSALIEQAQTSIAGNNGHGTITPIRNSQRAREVAEMRWSKYRRAGEIYMVRGVLGEHVKATQVNALKAYGEIVAKQAEAALTVNDNGTANTAAARFVREAIGADIGAPAAKGQNAVDVGQSSVTLSGPVAETLVAELLAMLKAREGK